MTEAQRGGAQSDEFEAKGMQANHVQLNDSKLNDSKLNDSKLNDSQLNDSPLNDSPLNATVTLLATFQVGQTLCALNASSVQEVIRFRAPTPIRHAAPDILGVINLRGKIVTLLDLGMRLGFGKAKLGPESRIFIVEDRNEFVGLLVDCVAGVLESEDEAGSALPANIPAAQAHYFEGIRRSGGRVIALLNASAILAEGRG